MRSQKYGVDLDEPRERRRLVLTLCNADFAIEWLRSMPPNFKMIGPVLPEPASPLPPNIEVRPEASVPTHQSLVPTGFFKLLGVLGWV